MAQVQLYAKKQGTEEYIALDLYPEEPIKLNLSVQNIEDPLAANSVFSRTFKVPNTSVNSPYFKAVFNVNSVDFDASKKADAYINDNNLYFTSGNIRLNAIYRGEKEDSVQYEITFYGETSDFGSKIGGGFLNELDFSAYNHNKSYNNVAASWNNGLFNGDIVYGLIEWGYNYNANNQPIEPTLSNGFNNSFTLTSKAYLLEQWKPQFRAKAIWDQVFEESGYTYDSVFLDSVLFKKMYVISDNIAQATLDNSNTFEAYSNRFLATVLGATNTLEAEVEITDPGNNWTPTTSRYRAPATGTYTFELDYTINIDFYDPFGSFEYNSEIIVVDEVTNSGVGYAYNSITSEWDTPSVSITVNLNAGQIVRFDHHSMRVSGNIYTGSTQITITDLQIRCVAAPNILSINGIMPSNIRKIDFMRSIINRFRLVFVPSREIRNHFTITPWKDWILEGNSIDWTAKLDTSKDLKITPLFYGQDRFQIYKDQEDGDFINYQYQLTYKQTVGQLNLDSTNELIKGTKTYQDAFAPTPIAPIGFKDGDVPGSRFVIPHIAKDVGSTDDTAGTTVITGKREPIQPKLRLVFYNGLIVAPLTWYARKQNGGAGAYETLTTYPLMSSYSSWPVSSSTFDLNWENEAPFWDATDNYLGNGQTAFSCFNTYWKTWYDVTFDPYSRIVEANLVLDYSDILDLKFNDYVFIKDTWYFVNNITDYIAGQSTNCRVQLIKVGNIGITLPIVAEVEYTPINLCFASTACFAFCCNPNVGGNPSSGTYYMDAIDLATTTRLYTDQFGSIVAPNGFYSDGTTTIQVVGGNAVAIIDTSACDCTVTSYPFTVKFASTLCGQAGVCCNGITQTVYGANPIFYNNSYLYYNAALTLPVGQGYYKEIAGTDALKVQGLLGQVIEIGTCTSCPPCDTYYPHTVCYATTEASQYYSCCCEDIQTVWTNNSLFISSTEIYLDNSGATPAPLGYYNEDGDIGRVNVTAGVISSFANCVNSDITCPVLDVDIEVSLTAGVAGYTSSATLYKSNDQVSWVSVGSVSIAPGDPGNTTVVNTFTVEELVYTKCTFTTNTVGGTMTTEVEVNLTQIQEHANATPVSYTEILAGTVSSTNTYKFAGVIEGGEETAERLYVGGDYTLYQNVGWPFAGGSNLGSIMALDQNADVIEDFDTDIGFQKTGIPGLAVIYGLTAISGNRIACGGDQNLYKTAPVSAGLTILSETGDLDTAFNDYIGFSGAISRVYTIAEDTSTGILYVGGNFPYWDQGPLGGTSDPYPNSKLIVALNGEDASTIAGFQSYFVDEAYSVSKIKIYNGKIYVAGSFGEYDGEIKRGIIRLNMDGTLDGSWNSAGVGINSDLDGVADFAFYNSYIYITGRFTSYNGVARNRIARLNLTDGTLDTGWDPGAGLNDPSGGPVIYGAISVDATGVYVGGNFTTYDSVTRGGIAKINHDATLNTTFAADIGFRAGPFTAPTFLGQPGEVYDIELNGDATALYVVGVFGRYKGVASRGIAKLDTTTGAMEIAPFAVGASGIAEGHALIVQGGVPQNTTYPLGLCLGETPCDAYCCTGTELVYYGNASNLLASTVLYANSEGTIPVNAGWYSDGTTIVQVDGNGNIVAYGDPESCICGPVLYPFDVLYDPTIPCNACCGALLITVWSTSVFWSAATILYSDSGGVTPALDGHYNYQGLLNNLSNGDGVVTSQTDCNDSCFPCPSQECAAYTIMNTDFIEIFYSYTSCSQVYFSGTLQPGEQLFTSCLQLQNFFITGSYGIINSAIC
jgi:hypothetical protein